MSFEIRASKRIFKEMQKLDEQTRKRILDLFIKLKSTPVPSQEFDVTKISDSMNTYSVRIQKTRIVYDVLWKEKSIVLLKIERRKNRTYKKY